MVPHFRSYETDRPRLIMDLDRVEDNLHEFQRVFPNAHIHVALKANPLPVLLDVLHLNGSRFEVASIEELRELVATGVDPRTVIFSNPVKIPDHVKEAYLLGLRRFAVDSDAELVKIKKNAPDGEVYIRLDAATAGGAVGSEGKFGVDEAEATRLVERSVALGLHPYGIGFHVGSQETNPDAWTQSIKTCGRIMEDLLLRRGIRLEHIDAGGGFPAHYEDGVPELTAYRDAIETAMQSLPYSVGLILEPGRAIYADAGTMQTHVLDVQVTPRGRVVRLDVGVRNGLMEILESKQRRPDKTWTDPAIHFPFRDHRRGATMPCTIVGPSGRDFDVLARGVPLSKELRVGDIVEVGCTGAYTNAYGQEFGAPALQIVFRSRRRDFEHIDTDQRRTSVLFPHEKRHYMVRQASRPQERHMLRVLEQRLTAETGRRSTSTTCQPWIDAHAVREFGAFDTTGGCIAMARVISPHRGKLPMYRR